MEAFDFGLRLKELRENRGLSQTDVAKRLKLKRATVSGYECNTTTPSLDVLVRYALLLNVSTDYLLGLSDREPLYLDGFSAAQKATVVQIVNSIRDTFLTTD